MIICAARLGNNHSRLGHGTYRDLLGALVLRAAGAEPAVRLLGGHRATELVVSERGRELVAHLITGAAQPRLDVYGAQQPAAVEDVASVARIELELPPDAVSAHRIVDGQPVWLPIHDHRIDLREADDWETIVIRRREATA